MSRPLIVITGKNGQLGWELQRSSSPMAEKFELLFTGRDLLDLSKPKTIAPFFQKYSPAYFINCAAYTAVDKAETEQELAYTVNAESVGAIAHECSKGNCRLISFSTDYVFNGKGVKPYETDTATDPINYYGYTKWMGEKLAMENHPDSIILRTSWVYSTHGNNFVKTMLRLMKEREEIKVVNDQIGSPTYAADLASAVWQICSALHSGDHRGGIYHYSNSGKLSWFEFAIAIRELSGFACRVLPILSSEYPTLAKRPLYSVMNTEKIARDFNLPIPGWKESLARCFAELNND